MSSSPTKTTFFRRLVFAAAPLVVLLLVWPAKHAYADIFSAFTDCFTTVTSLGGSTSSGDFGTMLKEVFEPSSVAHFEWDHWGTLRGQRVMAFSYTVSQARSQSWTAFFCLCAKTPLEHR